MKSRPLVFETGYRIITAPNTAKEPCGSGLEERLIEAVTFHLPITGKFLLADRGTFTWRYRNRLTLQRTFSVSSFHFIPYVAAEPFYESQYNKWSSTDLYAGSLFPLGKHVEFNLYYEHENDTSKKSNRQANFVGLAAYFYFSLKNN